MNTIPSDLLFHVSYIRWIEDPIFSYTLYIFALSLLIVTLLHIFLKGRKVNVNTVWGGVNFLSLDVFRLDFEVQCAWILRMYLESKYIPMHTTAHTSKDVYRYIPDKEYANILSLLESSEYSWKPLSIEQRREVIRKLSQIH